MTNPTQTAAAASKATNTTSGQAPSRPSPCGERAQATRSPDDSAIGATITMASATAMAAASTRRPRRPGWISTCAIRASLRGWAARAVLLRVLAGPDRDGWAVAVGAERQPRERDELRRDSEGALEAVVVVPVDGGGAARAGVPAVAGLPGQPGRADDPEHPGGVVAVRPGRAGAEVAQQLARLVQANIDD